MDGLLKARYGKLVFEYGREVFEDEYGVGHKVLNLRMFRSG